MQISTTRRVCCSEYSYLLVLVLTIVADEEADRTFSTLLRSEIMDTSLDMLQMTPSMSPDSNHSSKHFASIDKSRTPPLFANAMGPPPHLPSTPSRNLFNFNTGASSLSTPIRTPGTPRTLNLNPNSAVYSTSPLKQSSQRFLTQPRKATRQVSRVPYKVLDAPDLEDQFYADLIDWGSDNLIAAGLGSSVYTLNPVSGRVIKLCTLPDNMGISSVKWIERGQHLAIGDQKGSVQIWDAEKQRRLRTMTGHSNRVGALSWNSHILTTGSRDRTILHRDVRQPAQFINRLTSHKGEVCGLKWNGAEGLLASGGNDNIVNVWEGLSTVPLYSLKKHNGAIKALAWSPHQSNLLATGGGTADRHIRFWNTKDGSMINELDTGSQVSNLAWSKNSNEIVSTHGYTQNQVVIWKYPSMTQVACLTGHAYRILYLGMSPDGQNIVTGAADETLRFWHAFKKKPSRENDSESRFERWGVIR